MIKRFDEIDKIADTLSHKILNRDYTTIALIGDLGVGKTYFTKRICKNLGIQDNIKSPTFNYVHTYTKDEIVLSHFDVYRIEEQDEIFEIGYEDYLDGRILIIEWADKIYDVLPKDTLFVEFKHYNENSRDISIYFMNKGEKEYVNICNND